MTKTLTTEEMKKVSSKQKDICAYTPTLFGEITCVNSAEEAEKGAGEHGWWACNTKEVKDKCQ